MKCKRFISSGVKWQTGNLITSGSGRFPLKINFAAIHLKAHTQRIFAIRLTDGVQNINERIAHAICRQVYATKCAMENDVLAKSLHIYSL